MKTSRTPSFFAQEHYSYFRTGPRDSAHTTRGSVATTLFSRNDFLSGTDSRRVRRFGAQSWLGWLREEDDNSERISGGVQGAFRNRDQDARRTIPHKSHDLPLQVNVPC